MVLNLIPTPSMPLFEDIHLEPTDPRQHPALKDWTANQTDQTITHVATGYQFRAIRLDSPLAEGLVPFGSTYEVAVRYSGDVRHPIDGATLRLVMSVPRCSLRRRCGARHPRHARAP
jgi:hypothetical protein